MLPDDLKQVIEAEHRALNAFVKGDPLPQKKMFSRKDDAMLANPLDPPARGWDQIDKTLELAASQLRDGEPQTFEQVSDYAVKDLAYTVWIERNRMKLGGSKEKKPVSLRVTTIFRREDGEWKIVYRHADPIISPRPAESTIEK